MSTNARALLIGVVLLGIFYWWSKLRLTPSVHEDTMPVAITPKQNINLSKQEVPSEGKVDSSLRPKPAPSADSDLKSDPTQLPARSSEQDPLRSDYTAEQFRAKFRNKDLAEWFKEAHPYDYSNRQAAVPNLMVAFLIKGSNGENISYRQATGFAHDSAHLGDCISFRIPGQEIIVGNVGDGSLEVFETGVKWSIIFAINNQHFFLYHRDTTQSPRPGFSPDVVFYYERKESGQFVFRGEKIGDDENHASYAPRSRNSLDYCQNSY